MYIQTAIAEGANWKIALENFLLSYRTTPHAATGVSPAELFFNREIRDKLPTIEASETASNNKHILKDKLYKEKAKQYTDLKRRARENTIQENDYVLLKNNNKHRNKFTPRWKPEPLKVQRVKGSAIFMRKNNNREVVRNSADVKLYRFQQNTILPAISESDDETTSSDESEADSDATEAYEDVEALEVEAPAVEPPFVEPVVVEPVVVEPVVVEHAAIVEPDTHTIEEENDMNDEEEVDEPIAVYGRDVTNGLKRVNDGYDADTESTSNPTNIRPKRRRVLPHCLKDYVTE